MLSCQCAELPLQVEVVVCLTVLVGTARAHRTPAPIGHDFLIPCGSHAHLDMTSGDM